MKTAAIILLVLFLIAMLWLGVGVRYGDDGLTVWVEAAFLRFTVYPIRKKKPKKPAEKKKKPKPAAKKETKPKTAGSEKKVDIWELVGLGIRAAGRLRRKIKIALIALRFTAGSGDPYNTAMQYGYVSAAVGTLSPLVENSFRVSKREIAVNADFERDKPIIEGELRLGLFLWQIIYIACAVLADYLSITSNSSNK